MTELVLDHKHVSVGEDVVYVSATFDGFIEDFVSTKRNADRAIIKYINQVRGVGQSKTLAIFLAAIVPINWRNCS